VLSGQAYWDSEQFLTTLSPAQRVPDMGTMSFDFEALKVLAEGNTTLNVVGNTNKPLKGKNIPIPNIREGLVARPVEERNHFDLPSDGRVVLKLVSNTYLEMVDERE
jgi:hypothetical protein